MICAAHQTQLGKSSEEEKHELGNALRMGDRSGTYRVWRGTGGKETT